MMNEYYEWGTDEGREFAQKMTPGQQVEKYIKESEKQNKDVKRKHFSQVFQNPLKGELTIVISERFSPEDNYNEEKIVNKVKKYLKKYSLKDTVELILESEDISKNQVYDLCLKIKNEKSN